MICKGNYTGCRNNWCGKSHDLFRTKKRMKNVKDRGKPVMVGGSITSDSVKINKVKEMVRPRRCTGEVGDPVKIAYITGC